MASGSRARPAGRNAGFHELPPLPLWASGEKWRRSLGSTPTSTAPSDAPATSPPLSATPGGVASDQWADPGAAWKSSQKVLLLSERSPIGRMTQESADVETELTTGVLASADPAVVGLANDPHASRPTTRGAKARRVGGQRR